MKYILFTVLCFFTIAIVEAKETFLVEAPYITATNSPISVELTRIECNCVKWGKMYLGRENESWGIAGAIKPNSDIPWPNHLILLDEGEFGHLGVIQKVIGNQIYIIEANYIPCEVSTRSIPIDDPRIKGYLVLE